MAKEKSDLKEEKENSLFRVTLVMWRDARNSDTDYLADFKTKEEAIKYIEENSDKILEDEKKNGLEDLEELDLDVEEWVGDDIKGIIYSTRIWSKLPESLKEAEDNFKDLTIEEMFFEVAGKKFKVFDKNGHFTKEAYKLYNKVAERYGNIDKFDALCGEEGCFEDDEDIQYPANESLTEAEEDELSDDELDALDAEEEKAFKQKQADRRARVAGKRKEKSDKEAKLAELKKKLGSEYDFDKLFDTLVPPTGKADTVAGEVIRALNKVDYRDFNDGDVFYEEDGLDTCGGAMAFVADFFLDKFDASDDTDTVAGDIYDEIINMAEDRLTDSAYREQLYDLEKQAVAWIKAHEDILVEPNDKDCLTSFKGEEYWEDYIPSYDIEDIELPMNVKDLLELGEIDGDDIVWAVQDIIQGMGNSTDDVRYEGDYISVYGLSKADYDECGGDQGAKLYDWIEDWARNEYDDPDEIRARQEEEERQQYADDEESEEGSEEETDESLTEYASLEDRKPNKIFVEGDRVKYVNNDGWTEGGERNIGETGVIVDRIYQGNLEIFTVKRDVPKEYKGYEDTAFLATRDNLEFVEETDEGLEEATGYDHYGAKEMEPFKGPAYIRYDGGPRQIDVLTKARNHRWVWKNKAGISDDEWYIFPSFEDALKVQKEVGGEIMSWNQYAGIKDEPEEDEEGLEEAISQSITIYEKDKDGVPEVGREFIAYASGHRKHGIFKRVDKSKWEKESDAKDHISSDGEFYAEVEHGWIYGIDFDSYAYVDELGLKSSSVNQKETSENEAKKAEALSAFKKVFGDKYAEKLLNAFTTTKNNRLEVVLPFSVYEGNLDINHYGVCDHDDCSVFIKTMLKKGFTEAEAKDLLRLVGEYNWTNKYTNDEIKKIKSTSNMNKLLDNSASESYNDKELKEDASMDLWQKLESLYNEGNIWFDIVEKQNGGDFIIFEDWKSLIAVEKALKPEFEPKDEYDTSVLDELDIDYGFSDEWGRCDDCGKLIRLEADSSHWVPDFYWDDNGIVCGNCVRENPEGYISWLLESPAERANTILDNKGLESAGFHKVDGNYENGWYDRHDSPEEILNKAYEEHPEAEFIFSISGVGKFAVQFELWMRGE